MFNNLRIRIARLLAPDEFRREDEKVNRRVAQTLSQMDPFEPLMKEFHGVFSEEFEHPDENLDERSRIAIEMWGYQQRDDPSFKHFTNWIMNTHGNETLKRAPVTNERVLYGRAQISGMILFKKEVGRLASLYEERIKKPEDFNSDLSTE